MRVGPVGVQPRSSRVTVLAAVTSTAKKAPIRQVVLVVGGDRGDGQVEHAADRLR